MKNPGKRSPIGCMILLCISVWGAFLYYMIQVFCTLEEDRNLSLLKAFGPGFRRIFRHPLKIFPIPGKAILTTIVVTFLLFIIGILIFLDAKRKAHYQKEIALGDAKWLSGKDLEMYNCEFTEPFGSPSVNGFNNLILSDEMYLSMDNRRTGKNSNCLVIGGSGRGKSFSYVLPNLLQCNASFITTDPSGSLYRQTGHFFEARGYKVKAFNTSQMHLSCHYNPFRYIRSDQDIMILVDMLISTTTPPEAHSSDPFWEKAEAALFNAIIALQYHYMDESMQNFATTLELIRMGDVSEDGKDTENDLKKLFDRYRQDDPNGFAFKQYGNFIMGAGKTIKSILVSCAFRIKAFDLEAVRKLTSQDDIELDLAGDEKTAIFIIVPTGNNTFAFLVSMLYGQLFMRLYDYCETTARFSQLVKDRKGELIKTFRANDDEDAEKARTLAEKYLEKIRDCVIVYNRQEDWYEIRTKKDENGKSELVTFRQSEEDAKIAIEELKTAAVFENGERTPIQVRLLLDEFGNLNTLPEFSAKLATIRKYSISISIILQSIDQLKKSYRDDANTIIGNCSNLIYMGGGADPETTKWLSEMIGEETRQVAGDSFSKDGGSMSVNSHAVELAAAYQLRALKNNELVILPEGLPPYKGLRYQTQKHPNWKYVENSKPYLFEPQKINYLIAESRRSEFKSIRQEEDYFHEGLKDTTPEAVAKREEENQIVNQVKAIIAEEIRSGKTITGAQVLSEPIELDMTKNTIVDALEVKSRKDVETATKSLVTLNRSLGSLYSVYGEAFIDKVQKTLPKR